MPVKDYYNTLGIPPQSGIQDIKRAYRKLAMRYHPDKNPDDPRAAILFREVQEAYRILSDPLLREKYHRDRWLNRAAGRTYSAPPDTTPYGILLKVLELEKYMNREDPFRTDREGLTAYILQLLDEEHLKILQYNNDTQLNTRIVLLLKHASRILHYRQVVNITPRMGLLAPNLTADLNKWERQSRLEAFWNRYKGVIALLIAGILCVLIYFLAK